jgi:hypothetical protein
LSDKEKTLHIQTSLILGKDTSQMKLNDIIEELIQVVVGTKSDTSSEKNELEKGLAVFLENI